jgi:hypothetical protein
MRQDTLGHALRVLALGLLAGCSSEPAAPDWQQEAQGSLRRASQAYLSGDSRVAQAEFERARRELARTGKAEWVARGELTRCALRLASLETLPGPQTATPPCPAFEPLRADAPPNERAYADFLSGTLALERVPLLPAAQQAAAAAGADAARREAAVRAIADPVSRLVAAGAALRDGVAPPGLVALAIETASEQGWRRPLLAWLTFQLKRAEAAADGEAARALQRRIDLVLGSQAAAARAASGAAMPVAPAGSAGRQAAP